MENKGETTTLVSHHNHHNHNNGNSLLKTDEKKVNYDLEKETEWSTLLTIVGIGTTFGSAIPVGYNIGIINAPSVFMRTWCNQTLYEQYNLQLSNSQLDLLWTIVVSLLLLGGMIGSIFGAWIADRYGRKGSFIISCVMFIISAALYYFCRILKSVEMLLIGRLLSGLASGLTTTYLPMYLTEVAPLKLRGMFGVFCPFGVTFGVFISQAASLALHDDSMWHYALSAYVIIVIICLIPSFYYPESPKYLFIVRNNRVNAENELIKLRKNNELRVHKELEEMEIESNNVIETRTMCSVIKDPTLLMPLIIVIAYQGGQQLSGVNAVFYYSSEIYNSTGFTETQANWASLVGGGLNLFMSILSAFLMTKFNRRPIMLLSCGVCAIILFVLTIIAYIMEQYSKGIVPPQLALGCMSCIFGYIFFYQIGLGPIPYFIGAELFEIEARPVAMSLGSLSSWTCNIIIAISFPLLKKIWGAFVFAPFSITCIILFILTRIYVPETRCRNPSEIAPLISKGFRSRPIS